MNSSFKIQPPVDVLVPELSGGGAEKVARIVVETLFRTGKLGSLVAHRIPGQFPKKKAFLLPSSRWFPCLGAVRRWSIKNVNGVKFLNLGYVFFAPWLRILVPRSRILARPGNTISAELNFSPFWKRPFLWAAYQTAFLCASTVIAQSRTMAGDLQRTFVGISRKIQVLPNPVAPAGCLGKKMKRRQSIPQEPFIFCAMSFKPQKDFLTLFQSYRFFADALDSVPPLLVMAGRFQGPELRALVRREAFPHESRVRLVGEVADPDVWIKRAKFCVLSSHYEGSSNFLLEAVYHGKRIVATDCPGANREMARRHRGILLSRPGSPESMAMKMAQANRQAGGYPQGDSKDDLSQFEKKLMVLTSG